MLVIPAFQACMQSALIRANNKPPLEVVVANLESRSSKKWMEERKISMKSICNNNRGVLL